MILLKAGCIIKASVANSCNRGIAGKLVSNFYVINVGHNVSLFINDFCTYVRQIIRSQL